jgi:tetratricopeptide (TPR) repeat protein
LIDLERIKEAEAVIREPLSARPGDPGLIFSNGRILLAEHKYQEAVLALRKAVEADPRSASGYYFLGIAQKSAGLIDSARASFTRASELAPGMGQAEAALANLSLKSSGPDEAARAAESAIEKSPGLDSPYVVKAMAVIAKGDLQQGTKLLEEALRRNPLSLGALATLLKLSAAQGKTQDVLQRISELRDGHPQNAGLQFLVALGQFSLRDLDRSEASVRQAIKLDPQTRDAYSLLGQIDLARGSLEKAKVDYRSAIAANPLVVANYSTLGTLYEKEGNWDEAKKLFQQAHDLDPAAPLLSAELAFLYVEHGGDVNIAVSLAQSAKQNAPRSPITADALGWAYYKLGAVDLAIGEFKESTRQAPANAMYQYHLGMAYMTARQFNLAARSLRAALKDAPNFPYAASASSALEKIGHQAQ